MNYSDMVKNLAKPGDAILETLTPRKCHIIHMLLGVQGELSELYAACRQCAEDPAVDSDPLPEGHRVNIREELGDTEFYLEGLAQAFDTTSADIIATIGEDDDEPQGDAFDLVIAAGNLLDRLKKAIVYGQDFADKSVYVDLMRAVHLNLAVAYSETGITRDEALEANQKKLLDGRYKSGKYSDRQAQERADKGADDDAPGTVK